VPNAAGLQALLPRAEMSTGLIVGANPDLSCTRAIVGLYFLLML